MQKQQFVAVSKEGLLKWIKNHNFGGMLFDVAKQQNIWKWNKYNVLGS